MKAIKATSEAIVCTLSRDELGDVRGAWQKLFRTALKSRDLVPGGLRLTVQQGSEAALGQLIEIERDCCRWVTFVLDGATVTMTAEGEGEQAIRLLWAVDSDPRER